jgi:DnaK suppressor protein
MARDGGSTGSLPDRRPRATVRRAMPTKKSPFSKKELNDMRKQLEQERQELQRQAAEIEESSFGTPQSELSGEVSFDEEYADAGTATFERERDLSLTNNIRDLTEKIDRALERIDEGAYGLCERCGKPIEKARIKALPYATLCIKDKQAEERAG